MAVHRASAERQKPSTFSIVEVQPGIAVGKDILRKDQDVRFEGDGSLASLFIGLGIVKHLAEGEKDVLIVLNPDDRGE